MRVFDLHCDTMAVIEGKDLSLAANDLHIDLKRARALETYAQCYAVFVPDKLRGREAIDYVERVAARFAREMAENEAVIALCKAPGDLARAEAAGKHAGILTVESAAGLGGDLETVCRWQQLGVRMCTLTWNGENELGRGVLAPGDAGLTDFGRRAVRAFEDAGILVDVSHASPELFWDVVKIARKPLVASHSNAKAVCGHPRNLTREQFLAIRDSGWLVGLNYYDAFLNDDPARAGMEDLVRHAAYFLSLGGEDVLALGGDMDGSQLPEDMADGLGAMPRLYQLFVRAFGETVTDKIFYGNAARVFRAENLI